MTDTATAETADDGEFAGDPPAAASAVTKIPYSTVTAGWLNLFAPLVLVSLALSLVALIVALNADETTVIQGGPAGPGAAPATELTADMSDFSFALSSSTIAADTDVAVTMNNVGDSVHNFAVLRAGVDPSSEANIEEGMILEQFADVDPGASGTDVLNLPAENYLVVCLIAGHFDQGMKAPITVAGA